MTMKKIKNTLPYLAILMGGILAIATSAFAKMPKAKTVDTNYAFEYNGPDYSAANVQDVSNWTYNASPDACSGSQKACTIEVPDTYVDNTGPSPVLESTISIQTTTNMSGDARVSGLAGGTISNQN
jgi:hypothetical protein